MKKQKKWLKFRHKVIRNIAYLVITPYTKLKYGVKIAPFREKEKRQYLVLFNHQTVFDQFFVGISIRGPIYYMATEDIFSNGFVSSLIRYAVAPIPIKKQTTDVRAVMSCLKVAKEGGTIAMAPEGNRTYSGKTEYINPAVATLAKKLGLPILLYKIEGGYGVEPRWCDGVRKGRMTAGVSKIIEPYEYKEMSADELYKVICDGLYVNEAKVSGEFHSKAPANYLERAIYVCPECGLSEFESNKDVIKCKKCELTVRYLPTKELSAEGFPFRFVNDWYEYQQKFVSDLELEKYTENPAYCDCVNVSEVIPYKNKLPLYNGAKAELYGDRIAIDDKEYHFTDISAVSVLGRNKLNVYTPDKILQFKGGKSFCALKYVNFYYAYKNTLKGEQNVKFLGL